MFDKKIKFKRMNETKKHGELINRMGNCFEVNRDRLVVRVIHF